MGKLIITNNSESFTRSKCDCEFCQETHSHVDKWDRYIPRTQLQKSMINITKKIEDDYNKRKNKRK